MSSENNSNEELVDAIEADDMPSVDDFIKELEEKEKDLKISSDMVIEVGESSVEHENIRDSFVSTVSFKKSEAPGKDARKSGDVAVPDDRRDGQSQLEEQVEELIAERDDLVSALRRHKIDFENYRNRTERDRSGTFKSILGGLAQQILPILDNLDRAINAYGDENGFSEQEARRFFEGIVLVNQQINEVLVDMGVQPIIALGQPFDPNWHEAVDCVPDPDVPPMTVVEELLKGYRIEDSVVRASMVKVSEAPDSEEPISDSQTEDPS